MQIQGTSLFNIQECTSVHTLKDLINSLQPRDYFVVDVDDTLITPQAMMFRDRSPFYGFLDNIKKHAPKNLPEILSTWRLSRKAILVEAQWPSILKDLNTKGITVLALTQFNTGKCGKIDSTEKWRAEELAKMRLNFSPFAMEKIETIIAHDDPATLFQGILFTGSHSKADVLKVFINKNHQPSKIVFLDDRLHQVENIFGFCKNANISYHGYHYLGASQLPYHPELDLGHIQTQMILNQEWAEDDQINHNSRAING